MLIPIITFAAVIAIVFGAYWFVIGQPETTEQDKLRRRLRAEDPLRLQKQVRVGLLKEQQSLSTIHVFESVLSQSGAVTRGVRAFIDASGLNLTEQQLSLLLNVDPAIWTQEASLIPEFYEKFGAHTPKALWDEYNALVSRLQTANSRDQVAAAE